MNMLADKGNRPTVRGHSTDSGARTPRTPANEDDAPTVYGGSSEKFNARIIGFTKEGDVILRVSPEMSEELNQTVKTPASITWNEPLRKMSTAAITDDTRTSEPGTPRIGRPMHRSTSSATAKGKEREFIVTKPIDNVDQDDNTISNDDSTDVQEFKGALEQKEYAYRWRNGVEKNIDSSMTRTSSSASRAKKDKTEDKEYTGSDEKV